MVELGEVEGVAGGRERTGFAAALIPRLDSAILSPKTTNGEDAQKGHRHEQYKTRGNTKHPPAPKQPRRIVPRHEAASDICDRTV